MILTSIRNPLPYNPNHRIKPLCTSTILNLNPMTPNCLHLIDFTTIRILHHTSSTPLQPLTCHQTLTHLHSIDRYQTVHASYFSSFTPQSTRQPADGIQFKMTSNLQCISTTTTTTKMSTSACYLLSTLMMPVIVTDSVNRGRTGMNTRLALTQEKLYTTRESSSRRHAFLIVINISNGQHKSPQDIRKQFPGPSTLKKYQLQTQREKK